MAALSIIVGTYGDPCWIELALARAVPSALGQGAAEVISHHGETLASARNEGARQASGEWLCFLDADDELAPGYVAAMAAAARPRTLLAPAVAYIDADGTEADPVSLAGRDIEPLNPCVIGTAVEADLFASVGGFDEWEAWEDWACWLKCVRAGAAIRHVPDAVYRAHLSAGSRNGTVRDPRALHARIRASVGP